MLNTRDKSYINHDLHPQVVNGLIGKTDNYFKIIIYVLKMEHREKEEVITEDSLEMILEQGLEMRRRKQVRNEKVRKGTLQGKEIS